MYHCKYCDKPLSSPQALSRHQNHHCQIRTFMQSTRSTADYSDLPQAPTHRPVQKARKATATASMDPESSDEDAPKQNKRKKNQDYHSKEYLDDKIARLVECYGLYDSKMLSAQEYADKSFNKPEMDLTLLSKIATRLDEKLATKELNQDQEYIRLYNLHTLWHQDYNITPEDRDCKYVVETGMNVFIMVHLLY